MFRDTAVSLGLLETSLVLYILVALSLLCLAAIWWRSRQRSLSHLAGAGLPVAVLALLAALAALAGAPPAGAEGLLTGRLVNGTAGGAAPAGAEVALHVLRGDRHVEDEERTTTADAAGGFGFEGVAVDGAAYQVSAVHAGATYTGTPVRLSAEAPDARVELPVYDTTDDNPGVLTSRAVLVLEGVDRERQELVLTQLVTLLNPSDRTFLPSPSGPAGPMGLLRFGLPSGARELLPTVGLSADQLVQVDRGFASTAPVRPGESTIAFGYRLPYDGPQRQVENSLPTGAGVFLVLARQDGLIVSGAQLAAEAPVELGGARFSVWAARDLPVGTRLRFAVADLPPPLTWYERLADSPALVAGGVLILLTGGAVALWLYRGRPLPGRRRKRATAAAES